jgi:hypothetical protein
LLSLKLSFILPYMLRIGSFVNELAPPVK